MGARRVPQATWSGSSERLASVGSPRFPERHGQRAPRGRPGGARPVPPETWSGTSVSRSRPAGAIQVHGRALTRRSGAVRRPLRFLERHGVAPMHATSGTTRLLRGPAGSSSDTVTPAEERGVHAYGGRNDHLRHVRASGGSGGTLGFPDRHGARRGGQAARPGHAVAPRQPSRVSPATWLRRVRSALCVCMGSEAIIRGMVGAPDGVAGRLGSLTDTVV